MVSYLWEHLACDDAAAGSDFRATAGHFEASDTKYIYICGSSLEVYDPGSAGVVGIYQKGGNYNFYYDNASGAHSTYINADSWNNEMHLNGANLVMNVKQADTGGDQVWGPGASECVCFERQYNIADLTGAACRDVDSSALPAGKMKEELIAKEIESITTCTAGTGKIEETTNAKTIKSTTHATTDITEWTTCAGSMQAHTQAVTITEHQACVAHAEHFACVIHAETFEGIHTELFLGAKIEIEAGARFGLVLAAETEIFIGMKMEIGLGSKMEIYVGDTLSITAGTKMELDCATEIEMNPTTKTKITGVLNSDVCSVKKVMSALTAIGTP